MRWSVCISGVAREVAVAAGVADATDEALLVVVVVVGTAVAVTGAVAAVAAVAAAAVTVAVAAEAGVDDGRDEAGR